MKATRMMIAAAVIAVFFAACSKEETPGDVTLHFFDKLKAMDFEGAKEYATEETDKMLDAMAGFAKMMPDSAKKDTTTVTIVKENINGENADVTFSSQGKEETIKLKKVDGKWQIAVSKEEMSAKQGGADMSGAMPADSTMMDEMNMEDSMGDEGAPADSGQVQ